VDYKDYYKILGIPRTASQADIKKAFRKLAREHHPDVKQGDKTSEKRFKDVNEANEVLSDPDKRKRYDTLGANWDAFAGAGAGGADPFAPGGPFAGYAARSGGGDPGSIRYEFRTSGDGGGFSDFFRTFFAGSAGPTQGTGGRASGARGRTSSAGATTFEDILAEMGIDPSMVASAGTETSPGRTGSRPASAAARPRHVEATADVTLEEAFHGTTRIVEVDGRRLEVKIPRGVDTGSRIRLKGKGGDGADLYVLIKLLPHQVFTRRGADLHRELAITLREALLGAEVPVTTLRSRVLLRIPPGTQTGRTFRIKGHGMPRLDGSGEGDLYVKVRVVLPTNLSAEAREAAAKFLDKVDQPDPRAGST
jgi:curved DNA-binding protein